MNEEQAPPPTDQVMQPTERLGPSSDLVEAVRQYAHKRPKVVALCCLGIGFVLGWKLKLW